jgi:ABC-type lipoprotein release transport system permease subunit
MYNPFRKPEPPPPIYKRQPLATAAVILTLVGMFVLGPVGVIYNSMSEELKKKVDNKTLQLMIQKDREALQRQEAALKEKGVKDEKQDAAIIENQKTLIMIRQKATVLDSPKRVVIKDTSRIKESSSVVKRPLPPDFFEKFIKLEPAIQERYKKYLEAKGYDIEGL